MVLLRRVIGDALRARRQGQHRTLREVSTAANVSLGYLSEIERGQKEASSELLAAICEALGARLSEVLGEVSTTLSLAEEMEGVLTPVEKPAERAAPAKAAEPAPMQQNASAEQPEAPIRKVATNGTVSVSVRQAPLKATLRTTRKRDRDVIYAA
jgi:transcriptional regulator with XRE-family HTH domain